MNQVNRMTDHFLIFDFPWRLNDLCLCITDMIILGRDRAQEQDLGRRGEVCDPTVFRQKEGREISIL